MGSGILSIGASALNAAYLQLQTTGHNIANVNTPGYHRQETVLATTPGTQTGAGFVGRGVDVVNIQRRYDSFLEREVATQQAVASADGARAEQMARLDVMFSDPQSGVGVALDDFYASLADLSSKPTDASTRTVAYQRADALAGRVSTVAGELDTLTEQTNQRITGGAKQLTNLLSNLARLNNQIAQYGAREQRPNDLLDQRDTLTVEINKLMRANSFVNPDGTVNLYAQSGEALVIGATASTFETAQDPVDASKLRLVMRNVGGASFVNGDQMGGGSIAGLLKFRDTDLEAVRARVGQLAGALAGAFNAAQANGVDANGLAGGPMFTFTAPSSLASETNTGSAVLGVQIASSSALAATDYAASFDGTNWTIRRTSDGSTAGAVGALPQTIDGLTLSVTGTPSAGDTFTIKSGSAMARDFKLALSSPARIAAGAPVAAQLGASNTGDVKVASLAVTNPGNANLTGAVSISFTAANTYTISGPGIGTLTNQSYVAGQPIAGNGWSITLNGTPAVGDSVSVSATTASSADNRNAKAMADLLGQGIAGGSRLADVWADTISEIGSRAQLANSGRDMSKQLLADATTTRDSASGVNLDEEAARMLQFQQAYQAAAKLITASQAMFEALMNATAR